MPTKKDLAGLLSETPQQPLRRGRGLRLSRSSKQAPELASKRSEPPKPAASAARSAIEPGAEADPSAPADQPSEGVAAAALSARAEQPSEAVALPDPNTLKPERKQRKLLLRKDLLKQCKRIARAQDRKLYQVVESALEEYIQRYGAHE
jgi:hypothetical protein